MINSLLFTVGAVYVISLWFIVNVLDVPTVSIVSTHAIKDYVKTNTLFEARLPEVKMTRKLYIAYLKDRKHDAFIDTVINYLMSIKK